MSKKQGLRNESDDIIVMDTKGNAMLPGIKAVATVGTPSVEFIDTENDDDPKEFEYEGKKYKGIAKWGEDNDLPQQILEKVGKSEILSSGLYFNAFAGYGAGVLPAYFGYDGNGWMVVKSYEYKGIELKKNIRKMELEEIELSDKDDEISTKKLELVQQDLKEAREDYNRWKKTSEELRKFREENDINHIVNERLIDMNYFFFASPEIVLNKQNKITHIVHREAAFSRWEVRDENGVVRNHFYWHQWGEKELSAENDERDKAIVTPVLDSRWPLRDLKVKLGKARDASGKKKHHKQYNFILPIPLPSPGRFYYPKSPWYSVFLSGWYDLSVKIPEAKNAILDNAMTLNYHVELSDDYFDEIFREENITTDAEKKARIKKEYKNLNDFLAGSKNSGKSVISFISHAPDGTEKRRMKINVIDNQLTKEGGQYLEDSEESSNIQSYAMWVHPSLIGASPGKNKNINGTEARELFIIKQAQQKTFRDRALKDLYLVKQINGWDPELEWVIPNIELTTLDKDKTGSKEVTTV